MPGQKPTPEEIALMRKREAELRELYGPYFPPDTIFLVGSPMEAWGPTGTRDDDEALDPRYDWPDPPTVAAEAETDEEEEPEP
jgi:hypothetical protein